MKEKIKRFNPKIVAFNGKGIYEVFCGNKKFCFGKQPEPIPGTDTVNTFIAAALIVESRTVREAPQKTSTDMAA